MTSLEIRNIGTLATPLGTKARRGREQGEIRRISHAAVRAEDGRLVFVGSEKDYARAYSGKPAEQTLDAGGRAVIPGLVDAHTHPVWLGDRGAEIGQRLAGVPYATIAANGGGINATVRATRAGSEAELRETVTRRLETMLTHGTTTAEAKSGYHLTVDGELQALRLLASLDAPNLPRLVPTLLAAHEVPPEFRDDRAEWVRVVAEEIVPAAAREGLARFGDVFCEQGVFTVAESRRILEAARRAGLGLRVHADELALVRRRPARRGAGRGLRGSPPLHRGCGDRRARRRRHRGGDPARHGVVDALTPRAGEGPDRGRRPGRGGLRLQPRARVSPSRSPRSPCTRAWIRASRWRRP